MKSYSILIAYLFFFFANSALAQIVPSHKSTIHYTEVYFQDSLIKAAMVYHMKLFSDTSALKKDSALVVLKSECPAFKKDGLKWATTYFWYTEAFNNKEKRLYKSQVHSFRLLPRITSPYFEDTKFEILTNKSSVHAGGFLVVDYLRGIYDREGQLVWKLPDIKNRVDESCEIRDLKFTHDNTLTFLSSNRPLEIDLLGNVIWQLPQPFVFRGDTVFFHHDFRKTNWGTYFLLANRKVQRKVLKGNVEHYQSGNREFVEKNGSLYTQTDVALILEMNRKGEVLWWWDANEYLTDEDLNYKVGPEGFSNLQSHANALGVNAENTKVYLGFRDLSRLIKIDKATKKVELSYGQKYPSGEAQFANSLFKQQHDVKPTSRNSILIFNNNGPKGNFGTSSILELQDNPVANQNCIVWSFALDFDTLTKGRSGSGGNVNELNNGNILLCAGQLNRLFEVTRDKEIAWDAFIYNQKKGEQQWTPMPNYRASWINKIPTEHIYTSISKMRLRKKHGFECTLLVHDIDKPSAEFEITLISNSTLPQSKLEVKQKSVDHKNIFELRFSTNDKSINSKSNDYVSILISEKGKSENKKILIINKK